MQRGNGYQAVPPKSFEELLENLTRIEGKTIADLALEAQVELPLIPLHGKGFQGELIERFLGASARGLPIPDFPNLGVELKTIPVSENFEPLESTFICSAPLMSKESRRFENSILYHKISRVLFVFLVSPREYTYAQRYVAGYRFWAPSEAELAKIREDYEELMELVALGQVESITARTGVVIQMRPKAADGAALTRCVGPDGTMILTRPRGFYMRRSFTSMLIKRFLEES